METGVPGVNGLNVQNSVTEEIDREPENVTIQLLLIVEKAVKVLKSKKNSATLTHVLVGLFKCKSYNQLKICRMA